MVTPARQFVFFFFQKVQLPSRAKAKDSSALKKKQM